MHTVLAKQEKLLSQVNVMARALRVPYPSYAVRRNIVSWIRGWAGERVAPAGLYVLYWMCTPCVRHGGSAHNQSLSSDRTMGIGML